MEQATHTMMDRRLGMVEEAVSGLRERVARLETGQTFLMTMSDQRDAREMSRSNTVAEEMAEMQDTADAMSERHQKTATDLAAIRSFVDSRKEADTAKAEARRYYRSILVPAAVALFAWLTTGNIEFVKLLSGMR